MHPPNSPKLSLSIIIPTLNEAQYLPHLLTDLANQTFTDFEVIIIDAHSTDATLTKARRFTSKFTRLKTVTSALKNVCHQRNLGASHAGGEYLLFLDADDRLAPPFLKSLINAVRQHPSDLFTTSLKPSSHRFPYPLMFTLANDFFFIMSHTSRPFLTESCVGIRRHVFTQLSGFDPNISHGEGNFLVAQAIRQGFTFKIYPSLEYTYSTRRMDQDGLAKTIYVHLLAGITLIRQKSAGQKLRQLYSMEGGSRYDNQ